MHAGSRSINEQFKLKDLHLYNVLNSQHDIVYSEFAELAAFICNCTSASIYFLDTNHQLINVSKGRTNTDSNMIINFCNNTVLQKDILFLENDAPNISVAKDTIPNKREELIFLAGVPIISNNGVAIGIICCMDFHQQKIDEKQKHFLHLIARQISQFLTAKIKNVKDKYHAEERLFAEKKIAHLNFEKREEENSRTAYMLHEKIAQTLVAIKFYINFARSAGDMGDHYLEKSVNEIIILTDTITSLSKSITPTTYDHDNYADHINELSLYFGRQHNLQVNFKSSTNKNKLEGHTGLLTFRILQELFIFAKTNAATEINVELVINDKISIFFLYNIVLSRKKLSAESEMLQTNIANRVGMLGGKITQHAYQHAETKVHIEIPFLEE